MVTVPRTDLADPGFWARPPEDRLDAFRELRRRAAPVYFPERTGGFHALVRHSHVVYASRRPELFTSGLVPAVVPTQTAVESDGV